MNSLNKVSKINSFSINSIFLLFFVFLFFTGCSSVKTAIVTKDVYIPVKCEVDIPPRPVKVDSTSRNVISILEYTEKLEVIIEACVEKK